MKKKSILIKIISVVLIQAIILVSIAHASEGAGSRVKSDSIRYSTNLSKYIKVCEKHLNSIVNNTYTRNISLSAKVMKPQIQGILDKTVQREANIHSCYTGYKSNKLMVISPISNLPNNFDPTTKAWYREAVKSRTGRFMTEPYIDTKGIKILVTMSKPIYSIKDKQIIGAAGIDYNLTSLFSSVKAAVKSDDVILLIYNKEANVILSNYENIVTDTKMSKHFKAGSFSSYDKEFELSYNGKAYAAYQTKEAISGWTILTMQQNSAK